MSPTSQKCKRKCPEGDPCILNGGIPHALHVCKDPNCRCHSQERYDEAKRLGEAAGKSS